MLIKTLNTNLQSVFRTKKLYNYRFFKKKRSSFFKLNIKNQIKNNVLFKIKSRTYSGLRHQAKLPVRGQRTKTNAKTCKSCKKLKT